MYLRLTTRQNKNGTTACYAGLAENVWNPKTRRSETRVIHSFGRTDKLDQGALRRLVASINRVLDTPETVSAAEPGARLDLAGLEIERVYEYGVPLIARHFWNLLGMGPALRECRAVAGLTAPHEAALFAMTVNRLETPMSKRACVLRWLEQMWLPDTWDVKVDQLYRALDLLFQQTDAIEQAVFFKTADLLNLDVDLIFYDTTTAYFEIDDPDGMPDGDSSDISLRQYGHSKEGRDDHPQVIIALAVTRDGMPVRAWVLPGNTSDVSTVKQIKEDLRSWRLGRCIFVGDAGMYSKENLKVLSQGMGRYILAVPMRKVKEIEEEVLVRPGRYRVIAENLHVKEVWVGRGERRRRYLLCRNPLEAARERQRREQTLTQLKEELATLEGGPTDHPRTACKLLTMHRYRRYLSTDARGRPFVDQRKVKAAARYDGKFVVITNDDTLTAEDGAQAYKSGWIIESCFRRMKQTGLKVRPMFHWTSQRIVAHVKLCVMALQIQRAAEMRSGLTWAAICHQIAALKVVRYTSGSRTVVQRSQLDDAAAEILKKLDIPMPKQVITISESSQPAAT